MNGYKGKFFIKVMSTTSSAAKNFVRERPVNDVVSH